MDEIDLQEATRRDDVYNQLSDVLDKLSQIPVFPSLLWAWTFDIMKDVYINHQNAEFSDEIIAEGVTLKQIFDKFWLDVDYMGFSMDQGSEILEELLMDWMRENDFLVALDNDGWLQ